MTKKQLVDFVTELIRATVETSGMVYETKEVRLDDNFSIDTLHKLNVEGWRMLCTGVDLGLKNTNIIIMERAKSEFQLEQIAERVARELGIPEEVVFDVDTEPEPEESGLIEEGATNGNSSGKEEGSGEDFV